MAKTPKWGSGQFLKYTVLPWRNVSLVQLPLLHLLALTQPGSNSSISTNTNRETLNHIPYFVSSDLRGQAWHTIDWLSLVMGVHGKPIINLASQVYVRQDWRCVKLAWWENPEKDLEKQMLTDSRKPKNLLEIFTEQFPKVFLILMIGTKFRLACRNL